VRPAHVGVLLQVPPQHAHVALLHRAGQRLGDVAGQLLPDRQDSVGQLGGVDDMGAAAVGVHQGEGGLQHELRDELGFGGVVGEGWVVWGEVGVVVSVCVVGEERAILLADDVCINSCQSLCCTHTPQNPPA